ncbi:MAG TPA: hypothetical protein VFS43_07720 [Polyangiaceae bacterium]|nr:hypothetical protein [Polyangiaceae bacterium]
MQDGPLGEADRGGEGGVGVQGVHVAREAVEQGLLGRGGLFEARVGLAALGHRGRLAGGRARAAEVALAAVDDRPLGLEGEAPVGQARLGRDDGLGELLEVVEGAQAGDGGQRALGRRQRVHAHRLRAVHDHGEVAAGAGEAGVRGGHGRHDREGREDARAPPLVEQIELVALGADAERVEREGLEVVRERDRLGLKAEAGRVERHAASAVVSDAGPR